MILRGVKLKLKTTHYVLNHQVLTYRCSLVLHYVSVYTSGKLKQATLYGAWWVTKFAKLVLNNVAHLLGNHLGHWRLRHLILTVPSNRLRPHPPLLHRDRRDILHQVGVLWKVGLALNFRTLWELCLVQQYRHLGRLLLFSICHHKSDKSCQVRWPPSVDGRWNTWKW